MKILFGLICAIVFSGNGFSQISYNFKRFDSSGKTPDGVSRQEPLKIAAPGLPGEVDFGFFYFPYLKLGGAALNLGAEVRLYEETTWVSSNNLPHDVIYNERSDYGDIHNPIITNPQPDIPFMINAGYTYNNTRFGISWFRMAGESSQSGNVPGLYLNDRPTSAEFSYGFVSFFDMGWDLHASRNFPASWYEGSADLDNDDLFYDLTFFPEQGSTSWQASHKSSLNSFDLTVHHPVLKSGELNVTLMGGLHHGRWRDNLMQRLDITFHRDLTDKWTENLWDESAQDSVPVLFDLRSVVHNDITLETISSIKYNPLGVVIGLEADWQVMPSLIFAVKASTSRLRGEAEYRARGIDVDDIVETSILKLYDENNTLFYNDALMGYEYLSGEFDLPVNTWSAASSNYRVNFSARYEINSMISLTGGYFYSLWKDIPMSPQWTYSDQFTNPYGAFAVENSWKKDIQSDISSSGFMIGVGVRF